MTTLYDTPFPDDSPQIEPAPGRAPSAAAASTPDPPTSPVVETQPTFHRPTRVVTHLGNIRANLEAVRWRIGAERRIWAVVKANAYGHGTLRVAEACLQAGAYGLGIATVDEAIRLRQRFPHSPILLMGPSTPPEAEVLVAYDIDVAVGDGAVARALDAVALRLEKPARVHLKIDTGMGRFGFAAEEVARRAEEFTTLKYLHWHGLFTHFSVSDSPAPDDFRYTNGQLRWFHRAVESFLAAMGIASTRRPMLHACNSGGILQHPEAFLDAVRPGIMLYGHLPDPECAPTVPLLPGMTLESRIVHVRTHPTGTALSYGRTFVCARETRIGILPIGYGDGYHRRLSDRGEVVVLGRRAPIRGRVCMDQTLVDLTDIPEAGLGTKVVLFGGPVGEDGRAALPVAEVAEWLGTIPYEVTCHVGRRVPRAYEL